MDINFKQDVRKIFLYVMIIFIVITIATAFFFTANQEMAQEIMESFLATVSDDIIIDENTLSGWGLFVNNTKASAQAVIMGIIPFIFLPAISILVNAGVIGALFGILAPTKASIINTIIFGLLPHGIFELPALFISMALGIYLCLFLTRKILKREDKQFKDVAKNIGIMFVARVIPLLILAAVIEAKLTPILVDKFVL